MAKITKFLKLEWKGNKFPSILILTDNTTDYDPKLFKL